MTRKFIRRATGCTLQEVADELGLSRQRVQQIEIKAISKLRRALGSTYTGPIAPFLEDIVGRIEPKQKGDPDWREKQAERVRMQARRNGTFARKPPDAV